MGNFCKTIKKVFDPRLTAPLDKGGIWFAAYYNYSGERTRIAYGDAITTDERERLFNNYLTGMWRKWRRDGLL